MSELKILIRDCGWETGAPHRKRICRRCPYNDARSCKDRLLLDAFSDIVSKEKYIKQLQERNLVLKNSAGRSGVAGIAGLIACIIADNQRKEVYLMMTGDGDEKENRERRQQLIVADALKKVFPDNSFSSPGLAERARTIIQTDIREGRGYKNSGLRELLGKTAYYKKKAKLFRLVAEGLGIRA